MIFCTHPDWPGGPASLLYCGYWVFLPRVKQTVHAIEHPPLSSTKVKERVQIYLYLYTIHVTCAQGQQLMLKSIHLQITYFGLAENVLSITLAHTVHTM
jgi:hypothetical protein